MSKITRIEWAIRVIAVVGLALSLISLEHYINLKLGLNQEASFCNINAAFNCDAVNQSKWSSIFGTPLAAYGGAFYLFVILLSFTKNEFLKRRLLLLTSVVASVFSIALFYISKTEIGTLCIICIGMYIVNFSLLFYAIFLKKNVGNSEPQTWANNLRRGFVGIAVVGLFSLMYMFNITRAVSTAMINNNDFYKAWKQQANTEFKVNDTSLLAKDYVKGNANAPITIVEFSDMECSACRRFYLLIESMLAQYEGKVKIVFKNYPLDKSCNSGLKGEMHRNACYAAVFARCAGEQDKFWNVVDYVFNLDYTNYPSNLNLIKEGLSKSYTVLNLDQTAMTECIVSQRQLKKIQSDIQEGQLLGIHSTPSVWVNGKKLLNFSEESLHSIFSGIVQKS